MMIASSIVYNILYPEQEAYLILSYVLASPFLLMWIAWTARS